MKIKLLLSVFCLLAIVACRDNVSPAGVVATVNGEQVYLHSLQTLLDTRTAALGIPPRPSLDEMRNNYAQALAVLVTHALVRQELAHMGIHPEDRDYMALAEEINSDFGDDSLADFMEESSLRKDDWERLTRDYLALETFRNQVIMPRIKIDLEEIKQYYREHEAEFRIPAVAGVCFISAPEKEQVTAICTEIANDRGTESPFAQCVDVPAADVPEPWRNEAKNLKLFACGKYQEQEGAWRTLAITSRMPERQPPISEVYALIENILLEQKCNDAFNKWLEEKIVSSHIEVAPELNESLAIARDSAVDSPPAILVPQGAGYGRPESK